MSFVVITSAEAYDAITEAGEMPGLLALGAEIVLVRPLYDELARDRATAAFIAAHTPPFFIVRLHPWSRVYTAVSDYLRTTDGTASLLVSEASSSWSMRAIGSPSTASPTATWRSPAQAAST